MTAGTLLRGFCRLEEVFDICGAEDWLTATGKTIAETLASHWQTVSGQVWPVIRSLQEYLWVTATTFVLSCAFCIECEALAIASGDINGDITSSADNRMISRVKGIVYNEVKLACICDK